METYDLGKLFVSAISSMSKIRFPEVTWLEAILFPARTAEANQSLVEFSIHRYWLRWLDKKASLEKNVLREKSVEERAVMTPSLKLKRGMTLGTTYSN